MAYSTEKSNHTHSTLVEEEGNQRSMAGSGTVDRSEIFPRSFRGRFEIVPKSFRNRCELGRAREREREREEGGKRERMREK